MATGNLLEKETARISILEYFNFYNSKNVTLDSNLSDFILIDSDENYCLIEKYERYYLIDYKMPDGTFTTFYESKNRTEAEAAFEYLIATTEINVWKKEYRLLWGWKFKGTVINGMVHHMDIMQNKRVTPMSSDWHLVLKSVDSFSNKFLPFEQLKLEFDTAPFL